MISRKMRATEIIAARILERVDKHLTEGIWSVEELGPEVHVIPDQKGHTRDEVCLCVPIRIQDPGQTIFVHRYFRESGGH